jgi:tRNA threonylcarbamoyladenosine biosynthesis protein TsaB
MTGMFGLALETSGRIGSVALTGDGRVLSEEQFPHGLQHAARIITVIDSLCRRHGCKPGDLAEVYVSVGPGSFTGLRVGITVAKTLALAGTVKLVGVPSLHVLAQNAPAEAAHVVIVLDAKRGQIFTASFARMGEAWSEVEPAHMDTLGAMLARSPRPVHLLGEGVAYHRSAIDPADAGVVVTDPESWRARAGAVAKLGWELARRGLYADPMTLAPLYVRPPEAEEKFGSNNV